MNINIKTTLFIFIVSCFGGIAGFLVFDVAFGEKYFVSKNQLDLTDRNNNQGFVINNPTNVIVEQDKKVQETINKMDKSLFGLFKYKSAVQNDLDKLKDNSDFKNVQSIESAEAVALPITSDGWVMSLFVPEGLNPEDAATSSIVQKIKKEYFLARKDRKIYKIESVILDSQSRFSFWKIAAADLKVLPFASSVENGDMALGMNWNGRVFMSNIQDANVSQKILMDSDNGPLTISLNSPVSASFFNSFLFNINGDIMAFVNSKGEVEMNNAIANCLNCLLFDKKIVSASLGVKYLDLSKTALIENDNTSAGVVIMEFTGAADRNSAIIAGLKIGDVITAVDGVTLGGHEYLRKIIAAHKPGDEIEIEYRRANKSATAKVRLAEKK